MVMRRVILLIALFLCVLQFPISTQASLPSAVPAPTGDDMNFTLEGKITDRSPGKLTVSTGDNMIFHVVYNDKTEIKKPDGNPGTAQDLHIGIRISVAGDLAESGEITAKKIEIEPQGSGK